MNSTFDALREQIMEIADQELPRRFIDCASSAKADGSLLTEADLVMQRRLQALLREATPDYTFLGEEMPAEEGRPTEVIIAKHRAGPIGTKRLVFLGQYTRFDNAARSM